MGYIGCDGFQFGETPTRKLELIGFYCAGLRRDESDDVDYREDGGGNDGKLKDRKSIKISIRLVPVLGGSRKKLNRI